MTRRWVLYPGAGRLPDAASPDVRARSHVIEAQVRLDVAGGSGVVVAHGDRHAGYALHLDAGRLVHEHVHAGVRTVTRAGTVVPYGVETRVAVEVVRRGEAGDVRLLLDGVPVGAGRIPVLARARTGYTGMDVACDRGLTVGGYPAPARFPGRLRWVVVVGADDQDLDLAAIVEIEAATG